MDEKLFSCCFKSGDGSRHEGQLQEQQTPLSPVVTVNPTDATLMTNPKDESKAR